MFLLLHIIPYNVTTIVSSHLFPIHTHNTYICNIQCIHITYTYTVCIPCLFIRRIIFLWFCSKQSWHFIGNQSLHVSYRVVCVSVCNMCGVIDTTGPRKQKRNKWICACRLITFVSFLYVVLPSILYVSVASVLNEKLFHICSSSLFISFPIALSPSLILCHVVSMPGNNEESNCCLFSLDELEHTGISLLSFR